MKWTGKAYIYCPKSKTELLMHHACGKKEYFIAKPPFSDMQAANLCKMNGLVVAECDVKECFLFDFLAVEKPYAAHYFFNDSMNAIDLFKRSCLNDMQLVRICKGKSIYAYHLENVKATLLSTYRFYEDEACTKPIAAVHQPYQFAYRAELIYCDHDVRINHESVIKVIIFSDKPAQCASICNGDKDLEIRLSRLNGVTVMKPYHHYASDASKGDKNE